MKRAGNYWEGDFFVDPSGRKRKLSNCPDVDLLGDWRYVFEFDGATYAGEVAKVRRHDLVLSDGRVIKRTVWPYYRVSDKPPVE